MSSKSKTIQTLLKVEQTKNTASDNHDEDNHERTLLVPNEETGTTPKTSPWHHKILHLGVLAMWLLVYYTAILTSQISGLPLNIFAMNSIRFALQHIVFLPCVIYRRESLVIHQTDIPILLGGMISNVIMASSLYLAASFMPVGNLDAFFTACYILVSALFDFCARSITRVTLFVSLLVTSGMILVVQPWFVPTEDVLNFAPCVYLDFKNQSNTTVASWGMNKMGKNFTSLSVAENSTTTTSLLFGYGLTATGAITMTSLGFCIKRLEEKYPIITLMFWLTLLEALTSFVINMVWSGIQHQPPYVSPHGMYCTLFLWIFIVSLGATNASAYLCYQYFHVSTMALSCVAVSVMLYLSQRTFLSAFHPGNGNMTEILGVVIVIIGAAIRPVIYFMNKT